MAQRNSLPASERSSAPFSPDPSRGSGLDLTSSNRFRKSPALAGCTPKLTANDFSKSFAFGSPAKPSPLDKIRPVMQNFMAGFDESIDLNATFPRVSAESGHKSEDTLSSSFATAPMEGLRGRERLTGLGLDSVQFNNTPADNHNNYHNNSNHHLNISINNNNKNNKNGDDDDLELNASANWAMKSLIVSNKSAVEPSGRNPNKALLTINRSGVVLIANEIASELLNCSAGELVGSKISSYFIDKRQYKSAAVEEMFLKQDGSLASVSGKVHTAIDKFGNQIPVSVWVKPLSQINNNQSRFLVVLEKIARYSGWLAWDELGRIIAHDDEIVLLLGYSLSQSFLLKPVNAVVDVPDITAENSMQQVTCRTFGGLSFPATIEITKLSPKDRLKIPSEYAKSDILSGNIHVYGSLSGLVSFDSNGIIFGCNETFVSLMFGQSNEALKGQKVTTLLPNFYEETSLQIPISPMNRLSSSANGNHMADETQKSENESGSGEGILSFQVLEGSYLGKGKHANGAIFAVNYQVKRIQTENNDIFCAWISRNDQLSLQTSLKAHEPKVEEVVEEISPLAGDFLDAYDPLEKIGTGAFGFVQVAMRKTDDVEVVVKFLKKSKVLVECWEENKIVKFPMIKGDQYRGRIPREITLLLTLNHPNICKMIEVFHNRDYYQMVMKRTGPTFDLFEFIDENPEVDEPVASYIFRQIASAVEYLHAKSILHRDIRDENIILDLNFNVQVIDFGSAAYMQPGKLFDTFCGTLEYCAPEVLLGNPYPGPELEIFSMGVTLYTLVFAENPFFDVEETIAGILRPPFQPSAACIDILAGLLEPNPAQRIKISEIVNHPWLTQDVSGRIRQIVSDPNWSISSPTAAAGKTDAVARRLASDDDDEIDEVSKKLYDAHLPEQKPKSQQTTM